MLATLGAVCILAACGGFGALVAGRYRQRPRDLHGLRTLLGHLETEIRYASPLPDALRGVAGRVPGSAGRLAAAAAERLTGGRGLTATEAWAAGVAAVDPDTGWCAADRDTLLDLGSALGASGRDDQLRHLRLCCARLESLEAEAGASGERQARLWLYLGFLTGIGLLIALW